MIHDDTILKEVVWQLTDYSNKISDFLMPFMLYHKLTPKFETEHIISDLLA